VESPIRGKKSHNIEYLLLARYAPD
jgi:hypothetical protein